MVTVIVPKWSSIRDQYPRESIESAEVKNDVNSMRSIKRSYSFFHQQLSEYTKGCQPRRLKALPFQNWNRIISCFVYINRTIIERRLIANWAYGRNKLMKQTKKTIKDVKKPSVNFRYKQKIIKAKTTWHDLTAISTLLTSLILVQTVFYFH